MKNIKATEKCLLTKILVRIKADIFIETMEAWKQWDGILSIGGKKKTVNKNLFPQLYGDIIDLQHFVSINGTVW